MNRSIAGAEVGFGDDVVSRFNLAMLVEVLQ